MKLVTFTQYHVHMTTMTLGRSLGQRSSSASDGTRWCELAGSWTTQGISTKTYTNTSHSLATNWQVLNFMDSKERFWQWRTDRPPSRFYPSL